MGVEILHPKIHLFLYSAFVKHVANRAYSNYSSEDSDLLYKDFPMNWCDMEASDVRILRSS